MYLESEGYVVELASNGKAALELLRTSSRPGVILLDLMMPIMNGWDFLEIWERDPQIRSIPVILMTASAVTDRMRTASDILSKPFRLERMAQSIRANLTGLRA